MLWTCRRVRLEEVIYFASYVVTDPGDTPLEKKQLLSEKEYRSYREKYGYAFQAGMGAEAIKKLLQDIDLDKEIEMLKEELQDCARPAPQPGDQAAGSDGGVPQLRQPCRNG